jgi:hypothetical protein
MTSKVAPDFAGHTFKKIMVYADYEDLGVRERSEALISTQLRKAGTEAVAAIDIIFRANR